MSASIELRGLPEVLAAIMRVRESVGAGKDSVHMNASKPHWVEVIKRNFAAGGRPAKWQARTDGTPSNLHKSGELISSLNARVEGDILKIGTNKIYAAIHQFGGQTRPHMITAKGASFNVVGGGRRGIRMKKTGSNVLSFMMGGRRVFCRSVNHPGSKMPARPFLVIPEEEKEEGFRIILESIRNRIAWKGEQVIK